MDKDSPTAAETAPPPSASDESATSTRGDAPWPWRHRVGALVDESGYRRRAGCVVIETLDPFTQLILTSSSKVTGRCVFPAGGIEAGETPLEAALRETMEEAGITGEPIAYLGQFRDDVKHTVTDMWLLRLTKVEPNGENRIITRCALPDVLSKVDHKPWQVETLQAAEEYIRDGSIREATTTS